MADKIRKLTIEMILFCRRLFDTLWKAHIIYYDYLAPNFDDYLKTGRNVFKRKRWLERYIKILLIVHPLIERHSIFYLKKGTMQQLKVDMKEIELDIDNITKVWDKLIEHDAHFSHFREEQIRLFKNQKQSFGLEQMYKQLQVLRNNVTAYIDVFRRNEDYKLSAAEHGYILWSQAQQALGWFRDAVHHLVIWKENDALKEIFDKLPAKTKHNMSMDKWIDLLAGDIERANNHYEKLTKLKHATPDRRIFR